MAKKSVQPDTLIIGAGTIGLSLAWELANRGQRVCVLESGRIGRAASWAGAGILPPAATRNATDPYEQLKTLSHQLHFQWAERLQAETGIDTGFSRCGGVYLARTPAETATLAGNQLWWDDHGIEYQPLDRKQLVELEPRLQTVADSQPFSAWLLPDECQLRNPRHLQALTRACEQNGVLFHCDTSVDDIGIEGETVKWVVTGDGRSFTAGQVCLCSGAWAQRALTQLGIANGILPVRGQIVLYRCEAPPIRHVLNEGHRYLVPRHDGRLLAGSVEEEVGYVCETTPEAISQIRTWAAEILPELAHTEVERSWAGLRPGSYDGLPYLGRVPSAKNLFVAAGHFRSGLYLSCATAVLMANLMQGRTNDIDLTPFRVGRG